MLDSHIIQVYYCINTVVHLYLYLLKQERKSAEMSWNLDAAAPIYQQIKDKIKNDIISGKYLPGQKLPGVRDLATEASVNPNTMQRERKSGHVRSCLNRKRKRPAASRYHRSVSHQNQSLGFYQK